MKMLRIICAAVLLAFVPELSYAQFAIVSAPAGAVVPYVSPGKGFPRLQAALQNPAGQYIACFGESTPDGFLSLFGANDGRSASLCHQIAAQFRQMGYNIRSNSMVGNGNAGTNVQSKNFDTRINAGTWVSGTDGLGSAPCVSAIGAGFNAGPGGCYWQSVDNVSAFTFTPADTATSYPSNITYPTDTLEVWTLNVAFGVSGVLTINNGGASCGTINSASLAAGGFTWTKSIITCSGTGTVWSITSTSGSNFFNILNAKNSAIPEVSMLNMSSAGAVNNYWLQVATQGGTIISMIASLNPVAAIYQDLGNYISAGTSLANITSQTESIMTALQGTADFMLILSNPQQPANTVTGGSSPYDYQETYVTAQIAAANANNSAYFNWWKYLCGTATGHLTATKDCWQAGMGQGTNGVFGGTADPDHQSGIAYGWEAMMVTLAIRPPAVLQ